MASPRRTPADKLDGVHEATSKEEPDQCGQQKEYQQPDGIDASPMVTRSILVVLALSVHGLSLGLAEDVVPAHGGPSRSDVLCR